MAAGAPLWRLPLLVLLLVLLAALCARAQDQAAGTADQATNTEDKSFHAQSPTALLLSIVRAGRGLDGRGGGLVRAAQEFW